MKTKLAVFRDKISELEIQNRQLTEEYESNKKVQDNIEILRSEIIRKEAMIKNLRDALQKNREMLSLTESSYASRCHEFEKQIRALHRQLESSKQKYLNLEEENSNLQNQVEACRRKIDKGTTNISPTLIVNRFALQEVSC